MATMIFLVTSLIFHVFFIGIHEEFFSSYTLITILKTIIVAIVLLVVAIPEGLPMAVSIAMALSTNNMKKDKILIKNLESVQTCAMLHDICVGKTGTLTQGKLDVARYQICDSLTCIENDTQEYPDFFERKLKLIKN